MKKLFKVLILSVLLLSLGTGLTFAAGNRGAHLHHSNSVYCNYSENCQFVDNNHDNICDYCNRSLSGNQNNINTSRIPSGSSHRNYNNRNYCRSNHHCYR